MKWVKIRSWHAVRNPSRSPNRYVTFCGLVGDGPPVEDLPAEKSCESCLRITARQADDAWTGQPDMTWEN